MLEHLCHSHALLLVLLLTFQVSFFVVLFCFKSISCMVHSSLFLLISGLVKLSFMAKNSAQLCLV